jgi:hypothetical protein
VTQQLNLYNPALAPRVERVTGRLALCAMVVVCLCALTAAVAARFESARVARLAGQQDGELAAVQAEVTRMAREAAARKPDAAVVAEFDSLQSLVEGRRLVMTRLDRGELGDTGGVSEYLRAFARQRMDGIWLTALTIGGSGREISVQGRMLDAQLLPDYLGRLRDEAALRGRAFATLAMDTPTLSDGEPAQTTPAYLEFRLATAPSKDEGAARAAGVPR